MDPRALQIEEASEPLLLCSGLWAIRDISRIYYGSCIDYPIPADYKGDNFQEIGIFRQESGLWAIRSITRAYFGGGDDRPVTR